MNWKAIYGVAFLVGIGSATLVLMIVDRRAARPVPQAAAKVEVRQPLKEAPVRQPVVTPVEVVVTPEPVKSPEPVKPVESKPLIVAPKPAQLDVQALDPVAKEQVGRYALNFVGADPMANQVWVSLINDPSLSEKVREDLIEDLNENGFSGANGRRPTADDLPLIENRIRLLMANAPYAMDEANAASFAEAYKDLMNMWVELARR